MTTKEARKLLGKPAQQYTDAELNELLQLLSGLAKQHLGIKV
jgi:hypothetical protein